MRQAGFTLIELLVVLTVIGILAGVGVPAFAEMIAAQRRFDAAQQLASGLRNARVEAITRHQVVLLHAIDGDWSKGWSISTNPSGKGAGDERNVLLTEKAYSGKVRITASLRNRPYVSFNLWGAPTVSNGSLYICDKNQIASHYAVRVAVNGHVRIEKGKADEPYCRTKA